MTKSSEKPVTTAGNNMEVNDEKCHFMSLSTLAAGDHGQEISELVDALRKIGYFESFRVKDNEQFGSVSDTKKPQRKLKTRKNAAYRQIKKYYKSIKQYKKERLRRKLCWLLSGKFTYKQIGEMLGISGRTVQRDIDKIKPYYFRLSRSYFRKLEQERIKEFNAQLDGKTLQQRFDILTKALVEQKRLWQQREYNRHVIKFFINLDYIQYDGFPTIKMWPSYSRDLTLPYHIKFICIKDGEKHEMDPSVTIQNVRRRSWW